MTQYGFVLSDEGRSITAINDSSTTAITAGDPVYFVTNDDLFGTTASEARGEYTYDDVKVKTLPCSNTGYKQPAGIALTDAATSGQVTIGTEGLFLHRTNSDTEAGDALQFDASTSQKVDTLSESISFSSTGTSATVTQASYKVGRAITGGSADKKYILWKLNI